MSKKLSASLLAAAVALSPIPLIATTAPAAAQFNVSVSVGFDYFYDELSPYGTWSNHPRWGDVWHPRVRGDFRPYYRGYWVNTVEYGWTWETQDPWGDVPYHYGRWVYDPYDGWLWVPGYTWAPAWVVWRQGGGNIGWFPMPPDDRFLAGYEVYRTDWDWNRGYFGYSDWYGPSIATGLLAAWTFVALDRFADRDYYRYVQPRTQIVNIVNNTTNITNYVTVNNRIVNRSVDVAQVERASGRRIQRVQAEQIVRAPITTVETGRQVQVRERERHGGDVRASARDRVQRLPAQEAKLPVQERRSLQGPRDRQRDQQQAQQPQGQQAPDGDRGGRFDRNQQRDQQQAQQPQGQQPDADKGGRFERNQQRELQKAEPRGRIEREKQGAIEPPQPPDRGAALQQQREEQQRARIERERQGAVEQKQPDRGAAIQQQREEQQNRAAPERQQRDQAEQQNRARAEQQQQRAEPQNRAREEQAARAQQAERQQQAQAEQQNRARAQQAERQQQQQAAAEERQQRAKAKQQKDEEEKDRKGPN